MSGRDDRGYSDSRRHQSKPERESSPNRSRRDVKKATENSDRDQKYHRRLQDALPLDDPKYPDSKMESGAGDKKSNRKDDRQREEGTTKHFSDRSDLLHSKSYSQHDDQRRNSGQAHKSAGDKAAKDDGGWKDSKRGKFDDRKPNNRDSKLEKDDRPRHRNEKVEQTLSKKRTFTERKISPTANGNGDKEVAAGGQGVRNNNERERRNFHYSDRRENRREVTGTEDENENENKKRNGGYQSRGWFGGGENSYYNRGRDNNSRSGYRSSGVRAVEKWKHDLFDQANRSPSPKKDEDLTAKIESLLAS